MVYLRKLLVLKFLVLVLFGVRAKAQITQIPGGSSGGTTVINNITNNTVVNNVTYSANQQLAGCGIEYLSGLTFTVGACKYSINGVIYNSPQVNVTLATADMTNPRIDSIIVDVTSVASVLTGTAASPALPPNTDPTTQLELTEITVAANGTTPSNVAATLLYDETGGAEWTGSVTANLNQTSTNNPYLHTHDVEATAAVLTNNFQLVKPAAGTVDLATVNNLVFYIRSKAQWPIGTGGGSAARSLSIFWKNGSTQKGAVVVLKDGAFGFISSNTTSYQQVSIPAGLFGINGVPVTTLEFLVAGPTGSSSIGFYLDDVTLQSGAGTFALPATLMNFRGTWNATTSYNPNDTVVSGGNGYVALAANTNVAVTTTGTWGSLGPTKTIGASFGTFQSGASALSGSLTACTPVYFSGTILSAELIADVSGSVTVDVKTVVHGSWTGRAAVASITASATPALSSAAAYTDNTLTGWTKTVAANTDFCFVLTSPTTVAGVSIALKVQPN